MDRPADKDMPDSHGQLSDISVNNRRIAKNTIMLYVRMIVLMLLSFYTSRVVLDTLGVEDYGIYNVVGGIVVMFSFLNSAMSSATQRYLTFELGRGDTDQLNKIFVTSVNIHIIIAVVVLVLSEIIGLWLLYDKMTIPPERMYAAFWVFQFSMLSAVVMFISVPYNAAIIAHEKMSAFAYISIVEVILKLLIVYLLFVFSVDKLILYAFLAFCVQVLIRITYSEYCKMHFKEAKYTFIFDKSLLKEMIAFSGWNLWGNIAGVLANQGIDILLNMFYGPVVNAARGVAIQVQEGVKRFSMNFQTALNPQIMKTYASDNIQAMHKLIIRSSRFSFFLLYMLSLPVLLATSTLLNIWLKEVPQYTVVFVQISLFIAIVDTIVNPISVAAAATGNVRKYQSIVGGCALLIVPTAYITLKFGAPPEVVFIVHLCIGILVSVVRLWVVRPMIGLNIRHYLYQVYLSVIKVTVASLPLPLLLRFLIDKSLFSCFLFMAVCMVSVVISVYLFGLEQTERLIINDKIKCYLQRLLKY